MLEGKFKDKIHPRCGLNLEKVVPVIEIRGIEYMAKCPRCFSYLPVEVDPESLPPVPEPKPEIEPEVKPKPKPEPEPVKPDEIPNGMYWCSHPSCKTLHRKTSNIGIKHFELEEPPGE